MRIYLTDKRDVDGTSYPRAGFYNAPEEQAESWIDEGVAFEATEDNKVNAFRPGSDVAELVDFDAGDNLDGLFSTYQPLPEPKPEAAEAVESEDPSVTSGESEMVAIELIEGNDDNEEGF
ncbi:hypothetical protein LCGC14_0424550 [marine sediment metagenome]|uniref:Uncharacterized protein n=1 Tax=marine sediment metagenome TaxID=412755 RepID=A0A0F9VZ44_9ZZZZ